jgi:hypothetical protein
VGKSLGNVRREQPSFPGKAQVEGDGSLLLLPEAGVPLHSLTVLSKPSVISMRKKMMAKKVDAGMLAMASAYVGAETCPAKMCRRLKFSHTNNEQLSW